MISRSHRCRFLHRVLRFEKFCYDPLACQFIFSNYIELQSRCSAARTTFCAHVPARLVPALARLLVKCRFQTFCYELVQLMHAAARTVLCAHAFCARFLRLLYAPTLRASRKCRFVLSCKVNSVCAKLLCYLKKNENALPPAARASLQRRIIESSACPFRAKGITSLSMCHFYYV